MKKTVTSIAGVILTAALTVGLIQYMGHLLDPWEAQDGLDVVEAFHSLEDNSLDVIVYGSSHAWKGCDTRIMRDKYGISAYNYGCHWQKINTTALFLKDSLRTQSPKVVCIETYNVNAVLQDRNLQGEIYYTRPMKSFAGKQEYLKQCFGNDLERYASYYFPIIMFHDNWNAIQYENFLGQRCERLIDSAGFFTNDAVYQCELPDYETFTQSKIGENAIKTLDEIVQVCRDNDVQILFYTCPWEGEFNYSDALAEYAEKNGCAYLDLFRYYEETGLDGNTDLADSGHLNTSGAEKVADFLGKYIVENYHL